MNDALAFVTPGKQMHAEFVCVGFCRVHDFSRSRIGQRIDGYGVRWGVVIGGQECLFRTSYRTPLRAQLLEAVEGTVVAQVAIDIQQALPIVAFHGHVS
jgi:hypothetical protein